MFAPHLPPPSHSVAARQAWQRIKIMLVCTLLGLFAGAASAAVMVAWLFPAAAGTIPVFLSYRSNDPALLPLDQAIADDIHAKVLAVYGAVQRGKDAEYFEPRDFIGESLPVSSDGWAVMALSSAPSTGTVWYVVGQKGLVATTSRIVYDPAHQVVFFKVPRGSVGGNGRPLGFGPNLAVGDHAYRLSRSRVQPVTIERLTASKEREFILSDYPRLRSSAAGDGVGILVNHDGRLVGLETVNGLLSIPYFEENLPTLFAGRAFERRTLGVSGWFSDDTPVFFDNRRVTGFVVAKSSPKNSSLKKGDIVEEIEGNVVGGDAPWYTTSATSTVRALVVRDGKEQVVEVPLFSLDF